MARITLEDWYGVCDEFNEKTNVKLCWCLSFMGWDYDEGEALKINRDFLKALNKRLDQQEKDNGKV